MALNYSHAACPSLFLLVFFFELAILFDVRFIAQGGTKKKKKKKHRCKIEFAK
jgi:hypothetical protein